ncbi:MAG: hypothetical protein HGA31_04915 [Candidatus Moranbacteria bacterium]|nr:hypothetical protein [Candidatus Moranbacteria bacterium]
MPEVSEELRTRIRNAVRIAREKKDAADANGTNVSEIRSRVESMYASLNFRERHLGGWFGGDREKVGAYMNLLAKRDQLSLQDATLREAANRAENEVQSLMGRYLKENDSDYRDLLVPYEAAVKVRQAVDSILERIEAALSSISSAETLETFDLCSSGIGMSAMSYMQNDDANSAIESVRSEIPSLQAALRQYDGFLETGRVPAVDAKIDDLTDFASDMIFDGVDFMSIFTLSVLDDAESQMTAARSKIRELKKIIDRHVLTAGDSVKAHREKILSEIAG